MTGTPAGGKKIAAVNTNRYGNDYYSRIGKIGGVKGRGKDYKGGFAYVAPGQTESNGKRFAAMGGFLNKKSRKITIDDELRSEEINELLKLGVRVLGTLRMEGMIDVITEHLHHITLYEKIGEGDWPYVFRDCGVGPMIKVVWAGILSTEFNEYKNLARQRFSEGISPALTKEESSRFKIIKTLIRAFEVSTGVKVQ